MERADGERVVLASTVEVAMDEGDVFEIETPGGGGVGATGRSPVQRRDDFVGGTGRSPVQWPG